MSHVRVSRPLPATADEFLCWPGDGRAKHYELVDGEIRAMAPASAFHGLIQANLTSMIRQHLARSSSECKVLTEPAVKPRLRADFNVRIPDIGVTCSPLVRGQIVMTEPVLLAEVLSRSNRAQTWTNVWAYTTIASLREIVVVHSDRMEIQVLRVSAEHIWPENPETLVAGDRLHLQTVGLSCAIEDVYADTPL